MTVIKEGGDRGASGTGRHRIRRALVMAEVALAVMLVTSAGLLLRTVYNLTRVDAGFDRSRLVTFSMTLPRAHVRDAGGRAQVYQRLLDTLRARTGRAGGHSHVGSAAEPFRPGIQHSRRATSTAATGQTSEIVDYYQFVMSDYFETMGIPIVAGRGFARPTRPRSDRVVVVNETLANRLWKGRDPIGQRLRPNLSASMGTSANPWHTVIGVARTSRKAAFDRETGTELYIFIEQPAPPIDGTERPWVANAPPTMNVALRTSLPPAALSQTLERACREADPAVPVVRLARDGRGVRGIDSPAEAAGAAARRVCAPGAAARGCRHYGVLCRTW